MEVRVESKTGVALTGLDSVIADIQQRLQSHPQEWLQTLQHRPGDLADLEQQIHRAFARMADQVVAGLLAQTTADAAFADAAQKK